MNSYLIKCNFPDFRQYPIDSQKRELYYKQYIKRIKNQIDKPPIIFRKHDLLENAYLIFETFIQFQPPDYDYINTINTNTNTNTNTNNPTNPIYIEEPPPYTYT